MSTKKNTSARNSLHYPLNIDGKNMEKEILKPFMYLTTIPGKQIRNNLLTVLGYWGTIPDDILVKINKAVYLIHNSSLLLDDIQDYSVLRRGVPPAHDIYGIARTVISINWVQSNISELVEELNKIELTKIYMTKVLEICAGQGMELYWRDNYICPTETEYLQMIYRKTSLLFLLAQRAMHTFNTGTKVDTDKLLITFGIYFQINDDYQNLQNQVYFDSKGFCDDITEGKFSFPIVHAVNNFPKQGEKIIDILRLRTYDIETKKLCLSILEECGSFEYTRKKLEGLKSIVYEEIAKIGDNPLFKEFIEKSMITCL